MNAKARIKARWHMAGHRQSKVARLRLIAVRTRELTLIDTQHKLAGRAI